MPPAGVGVVLVVLDDIVVDGGAAGSGDGAVVEVVVVEDDAGGVAGIGVVCAIESGTAIVKLRASAPAASNAFTGVPPGRTSAYRS